MEKNSTLVKEEEVKCITKKKFILANQIKKFNKQW